MESFHVLVQRMFYNIFRYRFEHNKGMLYICRAIEKESKIVNAGNLRCELDAFGHVKK